MLTSFEATSRRQTGRPVRVRGLTATYQFIATSIISLPFNSIEQFEFDRDSWFFTLRPYPKERLVTPHSLPFRTNQSHRPMHTTTADTLTRS